ncbi:hypothetical protein BDZ91DRAFT_751436 [Kalaharituber pfeilii]|nr:hypothetical protein BDZ91DRAFT_751436 [Kalaharituber pfeilii]
MGVWVWGCGSVGGRQATASASAGFPAHNAIVLRLVQMQVHMMQGSRELGCCEGQMNPWPQSSQRLIPRSTARRAVSCPHRSTTEPDNGAQLLPPAGSCSWRSSSIMTFAAELDLTNYRKITPKLDNVHPTPTFRQASRLGSMLILCLTEKRDTPTAIERNS